MNLSWSLYHRGRRHYFSSSITTTVNAECSENVAIDRADKCASATVIVRLLCGRRGDETPSVSYKAAYKAVRNTTTIILRMASSCVSGRTRQTPLAVYNLCNFWLQSLSTTRRRASVCSSSSLSASDSSKRNKPVYRSRLEALRYRHDSGSKGQRSKVTGWKMGWRELRSLNVFYGDLSVSIRTSKSVSSSPDSDSHNSHQLTLLTRFCPAFGAMTDCII